MKFRFYNIGYFFSLAFQGIFRNWLMSFATFFVLTSALLVTGCTWAMKVNLDYNLEEINEYNKIVVFVAKDSDETTIKLLKEKIENIKYVETVEWITKEDVLRDLFEDYGDYGDILQMYDEDNPCKDELVITYTDSSKVSDIRYQIDHMNEAEETLGSVDKVDDRRDVANKIDDVKNIAGLIFTWLMVLLLIVSVFIIMNTIKLAVHSRREEVSIMRYIGASGFFVAFPFVLEGILLGFVSSAAAYAVLFGIYNLVGDSILGEIDLIKIVPFTSPELYLSLLITFLAIGVGLGIVGSLISLRRYNKD